MGRLFSFPDGEHAEGRCHEPDMAPPSQRGETCSDTEAIDRHRAMTPAQRVALAVEVSRAALAFANASRIGPGDVYGSGVPDTDVIAAFHTLFDALLVDRNAAAGTALAFNWRRRSLHVHGDVAWVNADGTVRVEPHAS